MKIALAQLNPTIGDIEGNADRIIEAIGRVGGECDLVVFPELAVVGYPPRDLLEKDSFIHRTDAAVKRIVEATKSHPGIDVIFGAPTRDSARTGPAIRNSAVIARSGELVAVRHKSLLPTYDVFDERRYFEPGEGVEPVASPRGILGISICEDAWGDAESLACSYRGRDPIAELAEKGAQVLINISASPFHLGKGEVRLQQMRRHARRHGLPFVYVNQVGGNDELLFDGQSFALDSAGEPLVVLRAFEEDVQIVDLDTEAMASAHQPLELVRSLQDALVMGIRDYFGKCGFRKAVIGLSGGIDSAVTCVLAARALGAENVLGVAMPSTYNAHESETLAEELARNLGIEFRVVPVQPIYESYLASLAEHLPSGDEVDVTLQNIQARIRGNILMAFSNRLGHLVLSTGNKSELSVGYCTLYGDMSGGLAAISDVPKTHVYELAHLINKEHEVIPKRIITRPPSAELKPDQTDQDTLPPYDVLDPILEHYIQERRSVDEIVGLGFPEETVRWVVRTVDRNEYKRRQAAPGLRVMSKAFGVGRRMPIAAKYSQ